MAYFVPAFVAFSRGVPNKGSVFVINLFLGWTVVGWIVALAMAARSNQQQQPRL
ncbi:MULTISPECIES: superinfection immunity protein [unclassified Streptomyces]|uniref:superinfection immunity protein n=1 Tax=unclassified Streptomyces TaxID=2593676 RepID=UPI0025559A8E|nr:MULTISPECIES: superinfection immunity protein [unclassified Streptomyces]WRZ65262.1 superinfection immunity protein [Streptomyces sp. NBC_01257]